MDVALVAARLIILARLFALLPLALCACGDKAQVVTCKQGKYQGKPDTQPWNNERFKDDRVAWQNAIKQRNQSQNEYKRIR